MTGLSRQSSPSSRASHSGRDPPRLQGLPWSKCLFWGRDGARGLLCRRPPRSHQVREVVVLDGSQPTRPWDSPETGAAVPPWAPGWPQQLMLPARTEALGGGGPRLSDACQGQVLGEPPSTPTQAFCTRIPCPAAQRSHWLPRVSHVTSGRSQGLPGPQRPGPGPVPKSRHQAPDKCALWMGSQRAGAWPGPQVLAPPPGWEGQG